MFSLGLYVLLGLIYFVIIIIIIIIFSFWQFRLVFPRSYIVTPISTLNKFHKQTKKQSQILTWAWKTYVVCGSGLTVGRVVITKKWEGRKNCECYVSKKTQESNIGFSNWSFSIWFFFSLFLLYSLFFICTFDYH